MEPVVTLQYPHEHLEMTPRFRGHIELIPNEETGEPKCIVCGMCQKGCPSGCISLAGEKREGVKGKVLTKYILNFTTCSLCGQCVESCKFGAIRFSKDYNLASPRKEDFIFDLIKRLKEKS
jgi:NADH-quinone oxidoreductase subunit I